MGPAQVHKVIASPDQTSAWTRTPRWSSMRSSRRRWARTHRGRRRPRSAPCGWGRLAAPDQPVREEDPLFMDEARPPVKAGLRRRLGGRSGHLSPTGAHATISCRSPPGAFAAGCSCSSLRFSLSRRAAQAPDAAKELTEGLSIELMRSPRPTGRSRHFVAARIFRAVTAVVSATYSPRPAGRQTRQKAIGRHTLGTPRHRRLEDLVMDHTWTACRQAGEGSRHLGTGDHDDLFDGEKQEGEDVRGGVRQSLTGRMTATRASDAVGGAGKTSGSYSNTSLV